MHTNTLFHIVIRKQKLYIKERESELQIKMYEKEACLYIQGIKKYL